jgi:hypothetical protein
MRMLLRRYIPPTINFWMPEPIFMKAGTWTHLNGVLKSLPESHCDWRSVSLSVLVSSPVWGSWPVINYCLTVTVLSLGGRPLWREDGSVVYQSVSEYISPVVARQWFGKNVTAATNTHARVDKLLDASFPMRSLSYKRKVGDQFFPGLLVNLCSYFLIAESASAEMCG